LINQKLIGSTTQNIHVLIWGEKRIVDLVWHCVAHWAWIWVKWDSPSKKALKLMLRHMPSTLFMHLRVNWEDWGGNMCRLWI